MEFTGSISDTSSGLYYMNARYYNPKTGRFLTQDAMGGDQWTNNLYAYCGNNPVSFIDPTGYFYYTMINGVLTQVASPITTSSGSGLGATATAGVGGDSKDSGNGKGNGSRDTDVTIPKGDTGIPLEVQNSLLAADIILDSATVKAITVELNALNIYAGLSTMLLCHDLSRISSRNHEMNYKLLRKIAADKGVTSLNSFNNIASTMDLYPVFIDKNYSESDYRNELGLHAWTLNSTKGYVETGIFYSGKKNLTMTAANESLDVAVCTISLCAPPPYGKLYSGIGLNLNMMGEALDTSKYNIKMIWGKPNG